MTRAIPRFTLTRQLLAGNRPQQQPKAAEFSFPQVSRPLETGTRGICSIAHSGRTFRFRTNPNEFSWTYTLNKHIDQTYGGRVVQLLSTKIDEFTVVADCGGGRWEYANAIAKFLRNVMIDQRKGEPAVFEYTTRGWKLNVYVVSIPFQDDVGQVLREFNIQMKVQEDVSGVMTRNSLSAELRKLQDGIGFKRNKYNDPLLQSQQSDSEQGINIGAIASNLPGVDTVMSQLGILGYPDNPFNPQTTVPGLDGVPIPTMPNVGG